MRAENFRCLRSIISMADAPLTPPVMSKFDAFDMITERAAISLLKLAGWVTTVAVVIDRLWRSL